MNQMYPVCKNYIRSDWCFVETLLLCFQLSLERKYEHNHSNLLSPSFSNVLE